MDLDARIVATLAYAGLFGAGLSESALRQRLFGAGEVHPDDLHERVEALLAANAVIRDPAGCFRLVGAAPPSDGSAGSDEAARQVESVRAWARVAGRLPFVRFIGLTGSLAKGSPGTDADLFVVATAGRVYLGFAFLKTVGAWLARVRGIRICVNFLVDDRHLALPIHDAFTATEFVTMRPLYDAGSVGGALWEANAPWVRRLCGCAAVPVGPMDRRGTPASLVEAVTPSVLEPAIRRWKRDRFVRRRGAAALIWPDVAFEPGMMKQHDASHRSAILARFRARLRELSLDEAWVESGSRS